MYSHALRVSHSLSSTAPHTHTQSCTTSYQLSSAASVVRRFGKLVKPWGASGSIYRTGLRLDHLTSAHVKILPIPPNVIIRAQEKEVAQAKIKISETFSDKSHSLIVVVFPLMLWWRAIGAQDKIRNGRLGEGMVIISILTPLDRNGIEFNSADLVARGVSMIQ